MTQLLELNGVIGFFLGIVVGWILSKVLPIKGNVMDCSGMGDM